MELEATAQTALRVALIIAAALVGIWLVRIALGAAVRRLLERSAGDEGQLTAGDLERRVRTLQRLGVRIASAIILVVAGLMILAEFSISIGPAIAGLGVVGIAVGFGAQTLIRDWLAGVFIILENQYSAGDQVRISGVDGVVEELSLRRTTLRDVEGTLHTVPNGSIVVSSNLTRGWARVNLDVSVPQDADVERATEIVDRAGSGLTEDARWRERVIDPPTVQRVGPGEDGKVVLKVLGQVPPAEQWAVTGELRKRILGAFAAEGIEVTVPQPAMVTRRRRGSRSDSARGPEATEPPAPGDEA